MNFLLLARKKEFIGLEGLQEALEINKI